MCRSLATLWLLCFLANSSSGQATQLISKLQSRPNVLFIAVDDLRPELGCYGASHIHSPNIDAFAASGRRFNHAYCQQAVCNPSRTSLMTGMRPDSIGVTGNHSHFRTQHPDIVTLPQHFKRHGYHAAAIGKIYHGVFPDGASVTKWDTMGDPESWSVPALRFGPRYYYTEQGIAAAKSIYEKIYRPQSPGPDDWTTKLVFGPATESPDVADHVLYDGQVANAAIERLSELGDQDQPFFLAVGFIKPHSPYIAPKKYFDLYEGVDLPADVNLPDNAPPFAGHRSGELRRYTDQPGSGPIPDVNQRRVRQAYYACVSYIDAQIGRVLRELQQTGLSERTIVVLYGDHGYHLGEQGLWGKTTNFELDTRVLLIIRAPGMRAAGQASDSLVELVDLYPTLAELAGLPVNEQLEGSSLVSVLGDPEQVIKSAAVSQYPRAGGLMGYSLRTPTHRLTKWVHKASGLVRATELYDYSGGLVETENLAAENPELASRLSTQLQSLVTSAEWKERSREPEGSQGGGGDVSDRVLGFERARPGNFSNLQTKLGAWHVNAGRALIDDRHAKTGQQCLQLTGGTKTVATLQLAEKVAAESVLAFWAERWTVRKPFSFRIEAKNASGWQEIFNGDQKVRFGRGFLSRVVVPVDKGVQQLRFLVTSPPKTGVLIDHLEIALASEVEWPLQRQTLFQQREIPDGVPRLGHAKDAKQFGYRIPSLLVTKQGSILAFSERRLGLHDHAQNDIVLKRSTDGGKTWSEEIVAYEDGMNSINDPLTVQLDNGRILLMFARFPYGRHARDAGWIKMASLGYDDPTANVLTFLCHSDDDGLTWSQPVDISRQVKHPALLNANTPGAMIQLTKGPQQGRIVTGLWGTYPVTQGGKRSREWRVVVAYSDDNGQSWQRTEFLQDASQLGFPNECQVVQAANADLVLISRNQGGKRFRKKAISRDGGETWTALQEDTTLPSVACMGAVVKGPVKPDGNWDLWASFPSAAGRKEGQIAVSQNHGQSWQIVKVIPGHFAYSALQVSPDQKSLLCLFEDNGYRTESFIKIPFDQLLSGHAQDSVRSKLPSEGF